MPVCLRVCFQVGLGGSHWLRLKGWTGWNRCNNCTQRCNASSNTVSIYKTAKWVQRPFKWNIHSDAHFKLAFKLYYPEWNNRHTEANSTKRPLQGFTAHIWTVDQPAGLQHTLSGCMWASLPKAGTERRQQQQHHHPPETTNTPRGLFVVVLTFFSPAFEGGEN